MKKSRRDGPRAEGSNNSGASETGDEPPRPVAADAGGMDPAIANLIVSFGRAADHPLIAAFGPVVLELLRRLGSEARKDRKEAVSDASFSMVRGALDAAAGHETHDAQERAIKSSIVASSLVHPADRRRHRPKQVEPFALLRRYEELLPRVREAVGPRRSERDRYEHRAATLASLRAAFPEIASKRRLTEAAEVAPAQATWEILGIEYGLTRQTIEKQLLAASKDRERHRRNAELLAKLGPRLLPSSD